MGSGACGRRRRTPKSQEEAIPPRGKTSARSSRKPTWPQSESICGKFVNFVATGSRGGIAHAYVWNNRDVPDVGSGADPGGSFLDPGFPPRIPSVWPGLHFKVSAPPFGSWNVEVRSWISNLQPLTSSIPEGALVAPAGLRQAHPCPQPGDRPLLAGLPQPRALAPLLPLLRSLLLLPPPRGPRGPPPPPPPGGPGGGPRLYTSLVGVEPDPNSIRCDMPVEVVFEDISEEISLPKFRPVDGAGGPERG